MCQCETQESIEFAPLMTEVLKTFLGAEPAVMPNGEIAILTGMRFTDETRSRVVGMSA